jgi:ArsR family transcriptional regulator, lead/cadmium/zinc/bismuth-responsive transcriptional repressor
VDPLDELDLELSCAEEVHELTPQSLVMPDEGECAQAAAIFRALGDERRLCLLALLAQQELCVTELTERLKDNLPAVSQRLKLLRAERIVRTRRQGKHIFYSLADNHIAELIANGLAHGREVPGPNSIA